MAIITKIPPTLPVETETSPALSLHSLQKRHGHSINGGATLDSALDALQANRVRSFLTMLGVIIGVSAVIAVVTLTQGVSQSVNERFAGLGTNVLTISPGTTSTTGARSAAGSSQTLTLADANAIAQLPSIINVSPVVSTSAQVVYGDLNWNTSIRGVYPSFQTIQNWQIAEGAWFSDQDEQMGTPVAVLGQTVVQNLFPAGSPDPIGQMLRIGKQIFQVVGVLQTKGTQGAANADDVIFAPFTAVNERLKPSLYVNQIQVQVDNINDLTAAQQNITTLLRLRHNLPGPDPSTVQQNSTTQRSPLLRGGNFQGGGNGAARGQGSGGRAGSGGARNTAARSANRAALRAASDPPNDFQVFNVNQLVQTAQQNSAVLTVLLIGIAAISLAVGGIGIMNIMLVSVTERTREIGIRMAIGARRRDIRNQFLLEAVMLSAAGGIIGILLGLGGGLALTFGLSLPFVLSPIPALVAFTISASVGIAFGLYPAVRAAKLDPIVALHSE